MLHTEMGVKNDGILILKGTFIRQVAWTALGRNIANLQRALWR